MEMIFALIFIIAFYILEAYYCVFLAIGYFVIWLFVQIIILLFKGIKALFSHVISAICSKKEK